MKTTSFTFFRKLFRTLLGRHPKTEKKKGGIKVHTVIHANEGVPSDSKFTSVATNDSFMPKPSTLNQGGVVAIDRTYPDYAKFEELIQRDVIYPKSVIRVQKHSFRYFLMATIRIYTL